MSPEVAGHVGVHVAKAVEGAKGQVEQEAPHKGEVPPYLKHFKISLHVPREIYPPTNLAKMVLKAHLFTPHHHHCCADLNPLSEMEIYIL